MITAKPAARMRALFAVAAVTAMAGVALPATFTVTNTNDDGPESLRWAIESANDNPGHDLIAFNIPGSGPHTIQPLTFLPVITGPVSIDGYTQPGAAIAAGNSPATLLIELDGTNVTEPGWDIGLNVQGGNSTVRGLVINRFGWVGIRIREGGANIIEGNHIGTDVTGTVALGNGETGVGVGTSGNVIGGASSEARNVISGNGFSGVFIGGEENVVEGNYIGIDATGTSALGNSRFGVFVPATSSGNTIGPGNVIASNGDAVYGGGVEIAGDGATTNHWIVGNLIGTNASGTGAFGNTFGIRLLDCSGNMVEDNIVSNSTIVGIAISGYPDLSWPSNNNTIAGNTVSFSTGFGLQIESSDHNTIYNNNFINNGSEPGYQVVDHLGTGNVFYQPEPIGGNYWSDWIELDINCDGVVDLPYPIWTVEGPDDYANQDRFPWACPNGWLTGCDCFPQPLSIERVQALGLPAGVETSLVSKLENAAARLGDRNIAAAISLLNALGNQVQALRDNAISAADADALLLATGALIEALEEM